MQKRNDLRFLLGKYRAEILGWRSGAKVAAWREIAAELARLEKEAHPPGGEVLRQAWLRLQAKQAKPVNALQTPVVTPDYPQALGKKPAEQAKQAKPVNALQTPVVTPSVAPDAAAAQTTPKTAEQEHAKLLAFREAARREKNLKTFASAFD